MIKMLSQQEFDAMHDTAFVDWWDRWMAEQMRQASSEDDVERIERTVREAHDRRWPKIAAAGKMIGELTRQGRPVHYIWPVAGEYREGSRAELIDFLIANDYV